MSVCDILTNTIFISVYITPEISTFTLLIINISCTINFQCLVWIFDIKSYYRVLLSISKSINKKIARGKKLNKFEYFVGKRW